MKLLAREAVDLLKPAEKNLDLYLYVRWRDVCNRGPVV